MIHLNTTGDNEMKRLAHIFRIALSLSTGAASLPAEAITPPSNDGFTDATVERMVDPLYPLRLSATGVVQGSTRILLEIDAHGELIDWLALSYTDEAFVHSIARVIDQWEFSPATRDGKNVPSGLLIDLRFQSEGLVMNINGLHITSIYLASLRGGPPEYERVVRLRDLDAIPEPLHIVRPVISSDIPPDQRSGACTFLFFIDEQGEVRMPVAVDSTGDRRLVYAAYDALLEWKFKPPTVRGRPALVRAKQAFRFGANDAQSSASTTPIASDR